MDCCRLLQTEDAFACIEKSRVPSRFRRRARISPVVICSKQVMRCETE
jgi:hypothetical protein